MPVKEDLAAAAGSTAKALSRRPAAAACYAGLARALSEGEAAWWPQVLASWNGRWFPGLDRACALLVAGLHDEALSGHPLSRFFPSCGGKPGADLPATLAQFFAAPPAGFFANMAARGTANYSPFWCRRWLDPARLFFGRRKLPFVAVELNSIGGLGVCADVLRPDRAFDSSLVTARVALAQKPLNLASEADARWAAACYLPDDLAGPRELRADVAALRAALSEEPAFVQGAACAPEVAGEFLLKNIPVDPAGGLLILSWTILTNMPASRREPFAASMIKALTSWGERALWVALERDRSDAGRLEVRVYRSQGARLAGRRFASLKTDAPKPRAVFDGEAAAFLA